MHHLEAGTVDSLLYRFRGLVLSPEAFSEAVWRGTLAQFVVHLRSAPREGVGILGIAGADFRNGFAHIRGTLHPSVRRHPAAFEAFDLLLDYAFRVFPFRKVYAEVLAPNLDSIASVVRRVAKEEGRLIAHEFHDGVYLDQVILAIHRDDYFEQKRSWGRALQAKICEAETNSDAASLGPRGQEAECS